MKMQAILIFMELAVEKKGMNHQIIARIRKLQTEIHAMWRKTNKRINNNSILKGLSFRITGRSGYSGQGGPGELFHGDAKLRPERSEAASHMGKRTNPGDSTSKDPKGRSWESVVSVWPLPPPSECAWVLVSQSLRFLNYEIGNTVYGCGDHPKSDICPAPASAKTLGP